MGEELTPEKREELEGELDALETEFLTKGGKPKKDAPEERLARIKELRAQLSTDDSEGFVPEPGDVYEVPDSKHTVVVQVRDDGILAVSTRNMTLLKQEAFHKLVENAKLFGWGIFTHNVRQGHYRFVENIASRWQ